MYNDKLRALNPNYKTPFANLGDAFERLSAYHTFSTVPAPPPAPLVVPIAPAVAALVATSTVTPSADEQPDTALAADVDSAVNLLDQAGLAIERVERLLSHPPDMLSVLKEIMARRVALDTEKRLLQNLQTTVHTAIQGRVQKLIADPAPIPPATQAALQALAMRVMTPQQQTQLSAQLSSKSMPRPYGGMQPPATAAVTTVNPGVTQLQPAAAATVQQRLAQQTVVPRLGAPALPPQPTTTYARPPPYTTAQPQYATRAPAPPLPAQPQYGTTSQQKR
eukprot:TRINITY_DN9868_c0_g1_i1.p1 TRINITY_DN9868_c0_g1~~TRINITY_DN9868_c0_g1_i1.p1  ORF type:complete len:279 (+),score=71.11 TRINITY_DN9868_c0_g1_i1:230-1066(+)